MRGEVERRREGGRKGVGKSRASGRGGTEKEVGTECFRKKVVCQNL